MRLLVLLTLLPLPALAQTDPDLRTELLDRKVADAAILARAQEAGSLTDEIRAYRDSVYTANAAWLAPLLDGAWPGFSRVGEDGSAAAFVIVQHADHDPDLQRRALALLKAAVAAGEASGEHLALLTDRVRLADGRRQLYGTQLDYDDRGCPTPKPVEDPDGLATRRAAAGLAPIDDYLRTVAETLGRGDRCAASARPEGPSDDG